MTKALQQARAILKPSHLESRERRYAYSTVGNGPWGIQKGIFFGRIPNTIKISNLYSICCPQPAPPPLPHQLPRLSVPTALQSVRELNIVIVSEYHEIELTMMFFSSLSTAHFEANQEEGEKK